MPSPLCSCPSHHSHTPSESLYQLLSQTSPENMHRNVAQYGLDPATRYPNLNLRAVMPNQVRPPSTPTKLPKSAFFSQARPFLPSHCLWESVLPQVGPSLMGQGAVWSAALRPEGGCLRYETYTMW